MVHLAEVRYVTTHLPVLQGLRLVPLGLLCSAVGLEGFVNSGRHSAPTVLGGLSLGLALIVVAIATDALSRHYQRTVGQVNPAPQKWWVPTGPARWVLAYWLLRLLDGPRAVVPLALLIPPALVLHLALSHAARRRHYLLALPPLMAVFALAAQGATTEVLEPAIWSSLGWTLIVGGVGDHMVLRAMLSPPAG